MNLIQQAIERAEHLERAKPQPPARQPLPSLSGFSTLDAGPFRPSALNPSRVPLAALALFVLAAAGGALVYATVARGGDRLPPAQPQAPAMAVAAAPAKPIAPWVIAAAPEAVVAAPTPVAEPEPSIAAMGEARSVIEQWSRAWSARDVPTYLTFYGTGFSPERGLTRSAWEKSRRQMIERRRSIDLTINDLRLEALSETRIVARYVQDYAADTYRELGTHKRLVLERESSGWRIVAEGNDNGKADAS